MVVFPQRRWQMAYTSIQYVLSCHYWIQKGMTDGWFTR
jgi:hypothetical protein